ncbi:MAG: siphovirus Gp157 family protein [Oscillospiraceae bacterium]
MSIKLYELSRSFENLWDTIDSLEPSDENYGDFCQAFLTSLEGMEDDFKIKAENIAVYIKRMSAESDAIAAETKNLTARKKALDNKSQWLKGYLMGNMAKMSLKKIEGTKAVLTVRNNPESVVITDLNSVLQYTQFIKPQEIDESAIDKTALKRAIQQGDEIGGASLVRGQSLQIK